MEENSNNYGKDTITVSPDLG